METKLRLLEATVISTNNIQSREAELHHAAEWAQRNNLKLNREKSVEIIFRDCKCKQLVPDPPTLSDTSIQRVTQMKILGDTVINHLSAREHVHDVVGK